MTSTSKTILVFFLLFCFSTFLQGQSLSTSVLASSGMETTENEFSLSWTIGENFVETLEITEGIQTLGFHQTWFSAAGQQLPEAEAGTWIFPNPVKNKLNIQSGENVGNANLQVFAITGELVFERKIQMENHYSLNLAFLDAGSYHLRIINHKTQNLKFIKMGF